MVIDRRSSTASAKSSRDPCGVCNEKVRDDQSSMECDLCERWVHQVCPKSKVINFTEAIYKANQEDCGASLTWFCPKCRHLKGRITSSLKDLNGFIAGYDAKLTELREEIAALKGKEVEDIRFQAEHRVAGQGGRSFQQEVAEALERERKKPNLVVVGAPETDPTSIRSDTDLSNIHTVCTKLGIPTGDVTDVFRNGVLKEGAGPRGMSYSRILKVVFSNPFSRSKFLRGYKRSQEAGVSSVSYVRPDLTFIQRQEDKRLRDELFQRRRSNPDLDLVIRNGKIVNRLYNSA